jgi:glycine/D-amino acid oxidase-like deaminating enzyme
MQEACWQPRRDVSGASAACACCANGPGRRRGADSPDHRPGAVPGLYINCGWGTGGFKAIPVGGWTLAHVLATGRNHELAEPFQLESLPHRPLDRRSRRCRNRALRPAR